MFNRNFWNLEQEQLSEMAPRQRCHLRGKPKPAQAFPDSSARLTRPHCLSLTGPHSTWHLRYPLTSALPKIHNQI